MRSVVSIAAAIRSRRRLSSGSPRAVARTPEKGRALEGAPRSVGVRLAAAESARPGARQCKGVPARQLDERSRVSGRDPIRRDDETERLVVGEARECDRGARPERRSSVPSCASPRAQRYVRFRSPAPNASAAATAIEPVRVVDEEDSGASSAVSDRRPSVPAYTAYTSVSLGSIASAREARPPVAPEAREVVEDGRRASGSPENASSDSTRYPRGRICIPHRSLQRVRGASSCPCPPRRGRRGPRSPRRAAASRSSIVRCSSCPR